MAVDSALYTVVALALLGLVLSVLLEGALTPRPVLRRPARAWGVHVGLWCVTYAVLVLLSGRPWCALAATSALLTTLVLVNNAKRQRLREPFIFQDYEYFLDTLRYPRLFLPFLGWQNFFLASLGFMLAVAGLMYESVPQTRFALNGQLGGAALLLCLALALLGYAVRHPLPADFKPEDDLRTFGLLGSLWAYGMAERQPPVAQSPFGRVPQSKVLLPHLVAVQSESFFDPRTLYTGIRKDVLCHFDALQAESRICGTMTVPAWGANTVRTEAAFLTGIAPQHLGVHQFNPYRAVLRGWQTASLPGLLRNLGYSTVCIHPYQAQFYNRSTVFAHWGFDTFIDIKAFADAPRFGPFVADASVGEAIARVLHGASRPVFVFAITMENHGPLHLERVYSSDTAAPYTTPPPEGCDELTVYLRHLRNADVMLGGLRATLANCEHPASLCWFGDHVPIMSDVYGAFGMPCGEIPYVVWHNNALCADPGARYAAGNSRERFHLSAHSLAFVWMQAAGIHVPDICQHIDTPSNVRKT